MLIQLPASDFTLDSTLTSGQTFRWRLLEDGPSTRHGLARDSAPSHGAGTGLRWWYGCVGTAVLRVRQDGPQVVAEASEPAFGGPELARYFALDLDLADILRQIDVDLQIHAAIVRHRGVRILRQEPWETLASFICASFNNIKRIEGMIDGLCQAFGRPVALHGYRTFTFPDAPVLAGVPERRLRALGLGYRAPYLKATARLVADGKLPFAQLRTLDYDGLKAALLRCDGVGDKVADCVALFGFEQYAAFPVDVWMERAMRYYFRHRRMTRGRLHAYARRHFGPYAGYAQQYLYHYMRHAHEPAAVGVSRLDGILEQSLHPAPLVAV